MVTDRYIGSRADILRRITDLFVAGSDRFDGEQRSLFDDVMSRLVDGIAGIYAGVTPRDKVRPIGSWRWRPEGDAGKISFYNLLVSN